MDSAELTTPLILDKKDNPPPPEGWDRSGLPVWAYTDENQLERERDLLFRRHWQVAGHVANAPEPGDFFCLDLAGERAVIVRGRDGEVRAFHNVCRHRGSRVVGVESGSCGSAIVCPFHGWSYNLDGTFRTATAPRTLPDLDRAEHGLIPVEMEIWQGFVFVRFQPGPQPSVAELMSRHLAEAGLYRAGDARRRGHFWTEEIGANWKCVRDVDNEGYHVPMAHPGLQDLYGKNYFDEVTINGTNRSFATFDEDGGRLWSVRHYLNILPDVPELPDTHKRAWLYIGLFPNSVFYFYPEAVGFYQEYPLAADRTMLRGGEYTVPGKVDETQACKRRIRAARYLANRINQNTSEEDIQLTVWSNEAAHSSGYRGFILSDLEYGVRQHHDQLRALMPELNSETAPA